MAGPALLLYDARSGGGAATLALDDLTLLLGQARGRALVVIDAGFSGRGRSVLGLNGPAPAGSVTFESRRVTVIFAGGADDTVLAPVYLGHGLLHLHHFVTELDRFAADTKTEVLGVDRLVALLQVAVSTDANYLGARQLPWCIGPTGLEISRSPGSTGERRHEP